MKQIINAAFLMALIHHWFNYHLEFPIHQERLLKHQEDRPEGGSTCAQSGCHSGTTTARANVISSDIQQTGYIAGATYNITVTVAGSGAKGFQVSAQKPDGTYLGTFTAGTGSRIMPTSYVTHSSSKSTSSAVWTFKWKAPAKGTGAVDFYSTFAVTRFSTYTDKYTVQESASSGCKNRQIIII
jgi:hypothetical protein